MNPSFSEHILTLMKSAAWMTLIIVASVIAIEIFYMNPDIFVELIERAQTVEVGNTKIVFGQTAFSINPDLKLGHADQRKMLERLNHISSHEFDRLLHLTEYDEKNISKEDLHCDYDNATSRMRLFAAADQGLFEKALVKRIPRADLTKLKQEESARNPLEIGSPSNCYQMVLTDEGRNLKSVVVSELTRAFGNAPGWNIATPVARAKPEGAPPAPAKEVRTRMRYQKSASLP
jgi:hypothetical protein